MNKKIVFSIMFVIAFIMQIVGYINKDTNFLILNATTIIILALQKFIS